MDSHPSCSYPRISFTGVCLMAYGAGKRLASGQAPTAQDKRNFRRFVDVASFLPAARVGRGVYTIGSKFSKVPKILSGIKRPGHTLLSWRAGGDFGMLGGPLSLRTQAALSKSLKVRSRIGLGLLGYSIVNPLENVVYIKNRDWWRLGFNYHLPIVGVPIYNRLTRGSGAPSAASSTRTKKARRPRRQKTEYSGTYFEFDKSFVPAPGTRKSSKTRGKRRYGKQRCPPGHYWSKRYKKCVRYRKRS